jgi:hypothetical protein
MSGQGPCDRVKLLNSWQPGSREREREREKGREEQSIYFKDNLTMTTPCILLKYVPPHKSIIGWSPSL